jgi:hypothetical protein
MSLRRSASPRPTTQRKKMRMRTCPKKSMKWTKSLITDQDLL